MRFLCEHCGAKYTIADEKVRNKVLKIRCKDCGNVIELRDPQAPDTAAPAAQTPAAAEKPDALANKFAESFRAKEGGRGGAPGTPGLYASVKRSAEALEKPDSDRVQWFVAIDNAPSGPMSARKVHAHRRGGRVSDDSLVWKEGLPDWTHLRNSKELIGLLALIDIEQIAAKEGAAPDAGPKLGLFAEPEKAAESLLKGRAMGDLAAAPVENAIDHEASFFGVSSAAKAGGIVPGALDADFDSSLSGIHSLAVPRPLSGNQNRLIVLVAVGFFVVAVATFGLVVFGGGGDSGDGETVRTVEKIVEKVVYRDRVVERPSVRMAGDGDDGSSGDARGAKGARGVKPKARAAEDGKPMVDDKMRAMMDRLNQAGPTAGAPIGSMARRPDAERGGGGGSLSANDVKSVVDRNKSQLKSCYERALKQGDAPDDKDLRVDFKLMVGSSGTVKSLDMGGEGAKIVSLKSCLLRSVKMWVFPSAAGESPVEFPFVFTPR